MARCASPDDVGALIRAERIRQQLTQQALAARAGVGRQWLVEVEGGKQRAHLGLVLQVLDTLGVSLDTRAVGPTSSIDSVVRSIRTELRDGDERFALRLLTTLVTELRSLEPAALATATMPPSTGSPRWDALVAVIVAREARRASVRPPAWTDVDPLPTWWFPDHEPMLTARTMQRTPVDFHVKGIWLDEAALESA